jgi:small subunit ribosomal protein S1
MVLNVDPEAEKIALGLKQTMPNPWREIEERYPVNSTVKGIVRNLTDYGAFVEIEEGIDALLHVSDISWTKKVNHPSEVLERGQEINVKILSIDPNNEKISVGLKQLESDPWQSVVERTPIGAHVEVEIAKLVSFGAFAKLENGVEGLIHVSELSDERIQKPEEVLNVGDTVQAKVISIDPVERKIGLSIREYKHDIEQGITSEYAASGTASVSIGEALGNAVPKSLLQGALDPSQAANQMLQEDTSGEAPAGETKPEAEAGPAPAEPPAPTEADGAAEPDAAPAPAEAEAAPETEAPAETAEEPKAEEAAESPVKAAVSEPTATETAEALPESEQLQEEDKGATSEGTVPAVEAAPVAEEATEEQAEAKLPEETGPEEPESKES